MSHIHHEISTECPYCGRGNELHTDIHGGEEGPQEDDFSTCWVCGGLSVFVASPMYPGRLILRMSLPEERGEVEERLKRWRAARAEAYTPTEALDLFSEDGRPS